MRIGLVNDMRMAVEALRRTVIADQRNEVAWIARDGAEAVQRCAADTPDLVLMDLIMPVMDGVEATRRIMSESPCAVLVVTATVDGNAAKVFEAMGHGALDAVNTPILGAGGGAEGGKALLEKIATIGTLIGAKPAVLSRNPVQRATIRLPGFGPPPLVVIGSSTGGPGALAVLLSGFPGDYGAAIVVIQHVDRAFVEGMAQWLDSQLNMEVRVAATGDRPTPGIVYLAASGDHLILQSDATFGYTEIPRENPFRPSVDVFFESVATRWPEPGAAVILTGMGNDGAEGLLALRKQGWHTVAQDEASSIIYGMPRAAAEIGAAIEVLALDRIGSSLVQQMGALGVWPSRAGVSESS